MTAGDYTDSIIMLACIFFLLLMQRFDVLTNGGASLTLSFERAPFLNQYRTVWVPWNVFYVMDTLVMKKVSSARPREKGRNEETGSYSLFRRGTTFQAVTSAASSGPVPSSSLLWSPGFTEAQLGTAPSYLKHR